MEESMKSERREHFTNSNQFINTTKSTSSEEIDNVSVIDDSVLSICPQCNFSTVSIQSLDTHMEQEHGDNSATIAENEKMIQQCNVIVKEEKFCDDIADKRGEFFSNSTLDNQTKSESSSVNSSSIVAGKQISDSRRRYRCNICPVTFPWHGDLAAHLSEVHGFQKASRDGGKTRAGSYKCSFCMYVAKYQSELKRHRRLHMGVKPFGCVFCKYRSAWKGDLKRHIESHHRGHFNSEEELASIMAQYKNNAGTDIKGGVEDDNHNETLPIQIQIKDEFNETTNFTDHSKFSDTNDSFVCDKCNFSSANKETFNEHLVQCSVVNFPIFDNQKFNLEKISPPFEMGLNLTVPSHSSTDFSRNFNPIRNFHHVATNNFPSMTSINESMLKIPSSINSLSDISSSPSLPSYMQGSNNDLLSIMVSQNNISFSDIVGRMIGNINGILPSWTLPNAKLIDSSSKPESIFVNNNPTLLKPNKTTISNFNINNHQPPVSIYSNKNDFSKTISEYEFSSPQKVSILESEKGFKSINGMLSSPRSLSVDIKPKDGSSGLLISQQEHWKRFKCSACGHRSNWKWDINKHIKVAHPERDGIATIELTYEEAKTTLQNYLNSTKANKARSHNSFESEEGYYRPYKCSACGHRSNWKWDVNKHIKQVHQRQAEVITLSMEEAKNTICQYKRRRRAPGLANFSEHLSHTVTTTPTGSVIADKSNISSPLENDNYSNDNYSEKEKAELQWHDVSPTTANTQQQNPRIDTLRLKRLKCDCCGYRSNYRSDISRHIRRKHDNMASVVFLADVVPNAASTDAQITVKIDLNDAIGNDTTFKQMTIIESNDQLTNQQRKLWQCNLCQFSHKEKIQVSHHITRDHDPERPFNCKLCNYGTDYRNSLLRHVKAKHKISSITEVMNQNLSKVRYASSLGNLNKIDQAGELQKIDSTQCSKCTAVFSSYQDLFQHTVTNHSSSDEEMYLIFKPKSDNETDGTKIHFTCSQCPFYSSNPDAAQIHQFQHSDICHYLFRCTHCNYKASHNKFLLNHIGLHLNISPFYQNDQPEDLSCPKTQNATPILKSISEVRKTDSMKIMSIQKVYCKKCSFKSSNICHLRVHLQNTHYKKFNNRRRRRTNKRIFSISNLVLMDENIVAYKNVRNQADKLWCDECGFLTNDESELRKHLLKHLDNNNDSQLKCALCTYNPDSNNDLKNHELLHVLYEVSNFKERINEICSLKCDKCNFNTNIIEKLDFHKHFHYMSTNNPGFSCPKCSFKHVQLYGLIKHLKYHH